MSLATRTSLLLAWVIYGTGCRNPTVREALEIETKRIFEKSFETQNHQITAKFISKTALVISRSGLDGSETLSDSLMDVLKKSDSLSDGWTFLLTLSPKNSSVPGSIENDVVYGIRNGFASYKEALAEYEFGWKEKIWIEYGGIKIPMANYRMENTFGMSPSRNFVLVFPETRITGNPKIKLVLDGIVPGMQREKLNFEIPMERYATSK
jgi:hypothetical protein